MNAEVLVGTHKGLFVLRGERGGMMDVAGRAFAGQDVEFAMRDPAERHVLRIGYAWSVRAAPISTPTTPPENGTEARVLRSRMRPAKRSSASG